ncbi:MAG: hypothetical protein HY790_02715 [Deltaproteobacteria bacterium]|nr:hypothetical protein [Deltaproteobacteria bacterium]MBI4794743.1 hypothetical protein [Deltaproteobacteria bacterium]
MARNRYGWEKRAKEMARKQKNEEKMKRRQGKIANEPAPETPSGVEEEIKTDPEAHTG